MSATLLDLVEGMPKAELDLHVEGALTPELIFSLAQRNGVTLAYGSVEQLRLACLSSSPQALLEVYAAGVSVLLREQDFYDITLACLSRARADHVRYVELAFEPQAHTARGVAFGAVIGGISRALRDAAVEWDMGGALIMYFARHASEEAALAMLDQVRPYRHLLAGVGLAASGPDRPARQFARVFMRCKALGLRLVARAGEDGPPASIHDALSWPQAERIGYGLRCLEDPALAALLAQRRVPLTMGLFPRAAPHKLRQLLDADLLVVVNSAWLAYAGSHLNDNLVRLFTVFPLGREHARRLACNSFEAAFLTPGQKAAYLSELDRYFAGVPG